jgi:hypothetical protein
MITYQSDCRFVILYTKIRLYEVIKSAEQKYKKQNKNIKKQNKNIKKQNKNRHLLIQPLRHQVEEGLVAQAASPCEIPEIEFLLFTGVQCCKSGSGRIRTFQPDPEKIT